MEPSTPQYISCDKAEKLELMKYILRSVENSHLLLDEDYEIISAYWPESVYIHDFNIAGSLTSVVGIAGLIFFYKFRNYRSALFAVAPIACYSLYKAYRLARLYWAKKTFEKMVEMLKRQYRLNKEIKEYFQRRNYAREFLSDNLKNNLILDLIRKDERDFCMKMLNNLLNITLDLRSLMKVLCERLDFADKPYRIITGWEIEKAEFENCLDLEEAISHHERLCDVYKLLTSSFLSCVTVTLSIHIWKDTKFFEDVACNLLPPLVKTVTRKINDSQSSLETMRYTMNFEQRHRSVFIPGKKSVYYESLNECAHSLKMTFDFLAGMREMIRQEPDIAPQHIDAVLQAIRTQHVTTASHLEVLIKLNEMALRRENPNMKTPPGSLLIESSDETGDATATETIDGRQGNKLEIGNTEVEEVYELEAGANDQDVAEVPVDFDFDEEFSALQKQQEAALMNELVCKLKNVRQRIKVVPRHSPTSSIDTPTSGILNRMGLRPSSSPIPAPRLRLPSTATSLDISPRSVGDEPSTSGVVPRAPPLPESIFRIQIESPRTDESSSARQSTTPSTGDYSDMPSSAGIHGSFLQKITQAALMNKRDEETFECDAEETGSYSEDSDA